MNNNIKTMGFGKKLFMSSLFLATSLFSTEFTFNVSGNSAKENISFKLDLKTDDEGKVIAQQKYDIRNLEKIKSLKIVTASGLLGTLKDEREIVIYYKTNLNIGGLKIRNLYKTAIARVYDNETNISMKFDPDHYQNIISYLRYHNLKQDLINDIDNMYGTWDEIDN